MKRVLLAAATVVLVAGSARAADMPVKAAPAPFTPVPAMNWSGFYLGGALGWGWGRDKVTNLNGYNTFPGQTFNNDPNGFIGSGTLGYNFQNGPVVYGIEGDLGWFDLSRRQVQPGSPGGDTKSKLGSGLYGDVTARLGYAWNQSLLYAKGGWAFYDGNARVDDDCNIAPCGGALNSSNRKDFMGGWTIGAGYEQMISPTMSWKIEYQHFDFGRETVAFQAAPFRWKNDLTADVVKVGLNWKLGTY